MNQNSSTVLASVELFDKFNLPFLVNAAVEELVELYTERKRHSLLNILGRTSGNQRHAAVA